MEDLYFQVYIVNIVQNLSEQVELINTAIESMKLMGYKCIGVSTHYNSMSYIYHFIKEGVNKMTDEKEIKYETTDQLMKRIAIALEKIAKEFEYLENIREDTILIRQDTKDIRRILSEPKVI